PVYGERTATWRSQCNVEDRAVLGDVDLVAAEHRIDTRRQVRLLGQRDEEPHRLVRHPVLRVVEVETRGFGGIALAPPGVAGEQRPEVHAPHLLVVPPERVPRGPFGERSHAGGHPQPAFRSVALFFPMQASSSSQDLTNAAAPSRWSSAARASRAMPARVNRWRVSSMLRPASCSRWVAFMLPPSGAAASAARAVPSADLRRQRRGLWGAPAGGLVLVHGRRR